MNILEMQDVGFSSPKSNGGREGSNSPQTTQLDYEQKRGKVVLEIFETEQIYQRLLAEFIEVFLRELESGDNEQARAFMSRPNLAGLCSNIEQISHLSQQLKGELFKVLDDAGAFDESSPTGITSRRAARTAIGPIFKRFASLLTLYEQYVENHAFAREDIQEFLDKPAFQLFWKKCADDARAARYEAQMQLQNGGTSGNSRLRKQSSAEYVANLNSLMSTTPLDGYLILPIQRVPRYVLLLKELHRLTEKIGRDDGSVPSAAIPVLHLSDSPRTQKSLLQNRVSSGAGLVKFYQDEVVEIHQAFKLVSEAATRMNEAIRGSETSQKMKEIQSRFKGDQVDLVGTGRVSRTLVREGELMRITQKSRRHKAFHFHLLTDMILYSELLGNGTLKLHRIIPLDGTCKVFANIPEPSGPQYEQYNPEKANADESSRRRSSIRLVRRKSEQPPPPPVDVNGSPREGETSDSQSGSAIGGNRAFEIATHTKTITLYAATLAEKDAWVRDIKNVIKEIAKKQNPNAPPSNSTLFSAEENALECQICGTPFSLLKRKHHCRRCGVLTCSDCCARKRIFASKQTPQRCCDVCRLEMDLTARDEQAFRFRIFVQIRSITGLGPLAKGEDRKDPLSRCYFALTQRSTKEGPGMRRGPTSVGHEASFMIPVGPKPDQDDSPNWVLRAYLLSVGEVGTITFDITKLMCAKEMVFKRKVDVSFPLKSALVDELCEVAPTIALRFELLMPPALWITPDMEADIAKEMSNNKRHFEHQASEGRIDIQGASSPNSHEQATGSATAETSPRISPRGLSSISSSRAGATTDEDERRTSVGARQEEEEEEAAARTKFTVAARLRRFEGEDDESDNDEDEDEAGTGRNGSVNGGMMRRVSNGGIEFNSASNSPPYLSREQSDGSSAQGSIRKLTEKKKHLRKPRGRLNVAVYAMYERIARERPSFWTVVCVKYLYIDTALRLANDESISANESSKLVSRDALASLQERFLKFDSNPIIRQAWESAEDGFNQDSGSSLSPNRPASRMGSPLRASGFQSAAEEGRRSLNNSDHSSSAAKTPFISQRALQYFEQIIMPPIKSLNDGSSLKRGHDSEDDEVVMSGKRRPLLRTALSTFGSQIFLGSSAAEEIHPRCLVLADLLRTEKAYIAALELLDEVFITPLMQVAHGASAQTVKQGVQFSRGTGPGANGSGAQVPQMGAGPSGVMSSLRQRRDASESKAVANAVMQPDATVLLQSVRQILTINKQLLRDLQTRLNKIDYSKCIGDIFCRFAVVLKVYNAYSTNHPSVEKILTPRDVPLFARRTSLPDKIQASPSSSPVNGGASAPGTSNATTNAASPSAKEDEDDGEGPCEALINFVKVLEDDERCEGRSFVQLLRLPKERLNRYKRILTSLLMHTPDDHNDAELLRSSLKLLDQSEKHISWSLRRRFNLEKLQDIQKSFSKVLPFGKQVPSLISARRWFKKEGYLVKRCRRDDRLVRFWLFNDALIYGVRVASGVTKSGSSFRFSRFLMLKDMTVHDLVNGVDRRTTSDANQELGDNRFAFEIRSPEKSFIVMVPHIMYDKYSSGASASAADLNNNNKSSNQDVAAVNNPAVSAGHVNELASDEAKKKVKDDWLREILQCIHDIHEEDEVLPEEKRNMGETTDSLFKKTASHNRKIDEKAAPVWVHDQASNTCSQCPNKFTLTFRRHHCRSCGALVCEACSKARVVLENIHPTKKQRVCKRCVAEMNEEEDQ